MPAVSQDVDLVWEQDQKVIEYVNLAYRWRKFRKATIALDDKTGRDPRSRPSIGQSRVTFIRRRCRGITFCLGTFICRINRNVASSNK